MLKRSLSLFAALFCFLPLLAYSQTANQKVVRVTDPDAAGPNEVSVAINPRKPDNIIVYSMQRRFADGEPGITNYAYVSMDGGDNWKTVPHPNPERRTQGDDAVTFGGSGKAYHSYIAFTGLRQDRPARANNGIFVTRSDDGGTTWNQPVPAIDHINTVAPFEDKPWLVTDETPTSPYYGNVYLAWTRFDAYHSSDPADSTQIYFTRSSNEARSFAMPYRISDQGGNALDDDNTVEGAVPAAGPEGNVYVAWAGPGGIVIDRSTDGGWTFGEDIQIADNPEGWSLDIDGINRANGMPVTDTDRSKSSYRGSVYVNWVDERHGDPDVFLAYSRDQGQTWSDPVRVNDDPRGNGKDQFFTWMAVDPTDGAIYIAFYDRRGLEGTGTALTLARSTDGGQSFTNYRIDQEAFETNPDVFFGDYLGIDAHDGRVVVGYQHFTDAKSLAVSTAIFEF